MQAVDLAELDLFEDQPGLRLAFPVHATTGTVASAAGYFEFEPGAGSCVDDRRRGDQWLARPMFDPVRWVNARPRISVALVTSRPVRADARIASPFTRERWNGQNGKRVPLVSKVQETISALWRRRRDDGKDSLIPGDFLRRLHSWAT
jgi:hypothetical protein